MKDNIMKIITYAVGDIHGRDDLLEKMNERIIAHHNAYHPDTMARVIYLGDYIDGGPDSKNVIDRLIRGVGDFKTICLRGNHEDMMLNCLNSDNRQVWHTWLSNGGEETLASFGISLRFGGYDPQQLAEVLGPCRIQWLQSLPLFYQINHHLFVHAGIMPGIPLEMQQESDLLWIRNRFQESEEDHGFCVIHGHTPADEPVICANRIGIDTGAVSNGKLTAVVLDGLMEPRFLSVDG